MPPAVDSAFDIAFWFTDQALNDNEYLQPQKLQRLLFLAQSYYSVAFEGKTLMPAYFIADDMGPIEPNIYRAFAKGRPNVDVENFIAPEVEEFLDKIWRRFGQHSVDHLTRISKKSESYSLAYKRSRRSEISLQAMCLAFGRADDGAPTVGKVVGPKVLRSHTGKPVAVRSWAPGGQGSPRKKD
jgi:uncharacterized phage-associated protein